MFLPGERNQRQRLRGSFNWTGRWTARQITVTSPVSQSTVDVDNTHVKFVRQLDSAHNTAQMMMVTTMMMTDDNKINEEVSLMLAA